MLQLLNVKLKYEIHSFVFCISLLLATAQLPAQTITNNTQGTHNGYFYSFWNDGTQGSASMTLGAGGNYSTTWNNIGNFTAGKGWAVGKPDRVVCFSGTYDGGSNGFLALYGWTKNNLIEYYVCESHGAWTPPGNTSDIIYKGTYTSDGGTYKIYTATRTNQPSIIGTATFQQFWSVRTEKRTSGTITFANHVAAWQAAGMTLGTTWDYQIMESEGYHSTGSSNITVSECASNGNAPVITLTPNNTNYAIGASATLSANATDSDGTITKVEFYNGTTLLNTATSPSSGSTYTYTWTNLVEGNYNLTAVATDNSGNKTTSAVKTITVGNPQTQLINNGEFDSGTTGWTLQNNSGATGTMSVVTNGNLSGTNSLRLCPSTNPGTLDWHVQVSQAAPIVTGKFYTITFMAKADVARQMTVNLQQAGSPYTTYFGQTVDLTTTAQTYTLTYNSTVTDASSLFKFYVGGNSSCVNIDKVSVTEGNFVLTSSITAGGPTTFCSGGSVVLSANTGTGYTYQWKKDATNITGATNSTYTATQSGSYTVSVTANSQTVTSAGTTVTVNALPTASITAGSATTFCSGGSVTLTSSTGSSYQWNNASGVIAGATSSTYNAAAAGSYTVKVTNTNNCSATSTATAVTVNSAPSAPTVASVSYCQGATASALTATGTSLKWYTNNTTTTSSATAPTPTTSATGTTSYFVSQTTNGCESPRAQITVTVNALPTATITAGSATTFCSGGSVTLTSSIGSSYQWNNASGAIAGATSSTYNAAAAGSYTVKVTNTNNCSATSTATAVTVNSAPSAPTVASVSYCQGATASALTATGTSLKWYTNNTTTTSSATAPTPSTSSTGSTSYFVSQTTNGCESPRAQITVTVNSLPTASITAAGSTALPPGGGSVVLNANTGSNLSYKWYNGSTQVGTNSSSYTATTVGSYTVEVTNASNCKSTSLAIDITSASNQPSSITITSPVANATISGTITISANITDPDGNISLVEYLDDNTVIGSSTSGPYSFDWTNPGNGTHTITIRVTDSNGGVTTSSPVTVTSNTATGTRGLTSVSANLYPNPANGDVFIETEIDLSSATFTLVNVLGEETLIDASINSNGAKLDVSNLKQGAYVLLITDDISIIRKKITVTR